MRRSKVRFGLLMVAVAMLVFLILFQQSLANALLRAFTGAISNQTAPVLVYSVDGQRVLQGSIITPDLEAQIASVEGIAASGRLSVGTFSVTADNELLDATIIGYERADLGAPQNLDEGRLPDKDGEVVASLESRADGFDLGETVRVEPGGLELTIVGLARESQLNVGPTLFASAATFGEAVKARNPDAGALLPNVIALQPAAGVSDAELVERVNAVNLDLDALTRDDAASKTPGVQQVRQSFNIVFVLYGLVVPLVTGLFFLILTFQKANALTLLRAIGAPSRRLVISLLIQVLVVLAGGLIIGIAGSAGVTSGRIGDLDVRFEWGPAVFWLVVLTVLGVLSSLVAARRVLRIDPMAATTGAGVGR